MPWDKSKYPNNWSEIRKKILERANNKCEWCGLGNHHYVLRHKDGSHFPTAPGWTDPEDFGSDWIPEKYCDDDSKFIKIILTTAHIHNPDPMDCREENLAALCQRCHNKHDAPMRAKKARETRERKKKEKMNQLSLFEVEQ